MSLEQAIQENTAALKALAALLANAQVQVAPQPEALPAARAVIAAATEAEFEHRQQQERMTARQSESAAANEKKEPAAKTKKPAPAPEPKKEEPAAAPITLADLQAEGKKLLDAGKQGDLKALVTKLGGTKLSTLDAAKYPEALAELKKLTANL